MEIIKVSDYQQGNVVVEFSVNTVLTWAFDYKTEGLEFSFSSEDPPNQGPLVLGSVRTLLYKYHFYDFIFYNTTDKTLDYNIQVEWSFVYANPTQPKKTLGKIWTRKNKIAPGTNAVIIQHGVVFT